MKWIIVIAGLTTALAFAASAVAAPKHIAACVSGVKKINGVPARTFCGPAKATVRINGQTVSYKGGQCTKSLAGFSINIGTVVLGALKQKPEYLGITVKATAGAHTDGAVAVNHAGKGLAVLGTVTLKAGLKAGTFTGKVFGAPTRVSGSFTC
jgi:hypothetical protein